MKRIPTQLRAVRLFIFLLSIAFFYNQVTNKIPTRLRTDQALESRFGLISVGDYSLPARSHGFDVIFVHGLGSNPDTTWRARKLITITPDGVVESAPSDLLPEDLPIEICRDTRIFFYNYDSHWERDAVQTRLWNLGNGLLEHISGGIRRSKEKHSRGLIFVECSYGGLVVKQAFCHAQNRQQFAYVVQHTKAMLFLGTSFSTWGYMVAQALQPVGLNPSILAKVDYDSTSLLDLHRKVRQGVPSLYLPVFTYRCSKRQASLKAPWLHGHCPNKPIHDMRRYNGLITPASRGSSKRLAWRLLPALLLFSCSAQLQITTSSVGTMLRSLFAAALAWITLGLLSAPASADRTLSIWDEDGFDQVRWCVSQAFTNWDEGGLWNGALQCSKQNGHYLDSCVCRCDLRIIAESYISSYAKSACNTNTVDIQSGLLLYDAYCATALPSACPGYTPVQVGVTLPTTAPATLSIWSEDGFTQARSCVTEAFVNWDEGGLWNGGLMCNKNANGAYLNQCVCRSDILSLGESYISSVIKTGCSSNTVDIQSGLSLYDSYCANAFVSKAQVTAEGTTTQDLSGTRTSLWFMATATNSSGSSPTSSSDPSGGGLSLSDRIALGVGIGVGLPATVATLIMCCYTIRGRG